MQLALEAFIVVSVVALFLFFFFTLLNNPERFFRLATRFFFTSFSESGRRSLARMFPQMGYYYFGTTGDAVRDATIRRKTRLYSRGFVLASFGGILFMFLFTMAMDVFS